MTRVMLAALLVLAACGGVAQPSAQPAASTARPAPSATPRAASATPAASAAAPFLSMALTDVRTGEQFRLGDFAGKVTLVQAMAVW